MTDDDEIVEAMARAISHVRLEFQDEPLGMNATRKDVVAIARAALRAYRERMELL